MTCYRPISLLVDGKVHLGIIYSTDPRVRSRVDSVGERAPESRLSPVELVVDRTKISL